MSTFTGPAFAVESVTPLGLATIRVKFSQDPRVTDGSNVDSALNIDNYILTGKNTNYVTAAEAVVDDPQSVDLFLAAALELGEWILAVINVVDDTDSTLVDPGSLSFFVTKTATHGLLSAGATNDPIENVLRKFLNPALKGKGWDAMIAALAVGDRVNRDNSKLAFDQVFLCTSSGKYLEQRGGDVGQRRPAGVDMSDELFRRLAIVSKTRQLTQEAILEILEVFYGSDSVRASMTSAASEPYALEEGDELALLLDETLLVTVVFPRGNFQRLGEFSAIEAAAAITRALRLAGSQAFALAVTDHATGLAGVQIYSSSLGLSSSIRVVGGRAQTQFLFPESLFTNTGTLPTWDVELSPTNPGNLRFTITAGDTFDLALVEAGDLAYIYGSEFANCECNGTFEIQEVSVLYSGMTKIQWFEIANAIGVADSGIVQAEFEDLMFFRPVKRTIYDQPRHVIVAQGLTQLDVVIPATTQVVGRRPGLAAYLNVAPALEVSSLIRQANGTVTVTTTENHGLSVGSLATIDGVLPTGTLPSVTSGTASPDYSSNVANGTTDASQKTTLSEAHTFEAINHQVVRLPEGMLMVLGGQTSAPANLANPVILEITGETILADGSRQQDYRWTKLATRTYHIGHRGFGASVLLDGRVLVTGGTDGDDSSGTSLATYDLFSYTNSPPVNSQVNGSIPTGLVGHGQVTLADGFAVICGGWHTAATPVKSSYYMDPSSLVWTAGGNMARARKYHAFVALDQGVQALAIGGVGATGAPLPFCELWDEGAHIWHHAGSMTYARSGCAAVKIGDGRIVVIGGKGFHATQSAPSNAQLATCEIYDQTTDQWSPLPSMSSARGDFPAATYIPSKNVIVVSGGSAASIEVLDLNKMQWRTLSATSPTNRFSSVCGRLGTDTFALIGGFNTIATAKLNYLGILGEDRFRQGGLNREIRVASVPTDNSFTYATDPTYSGYVVAGDGVTVTPTAAPAAPAGIPGPFSYDTVNGRAVTAIEATLAQDLFQGQQYPSITLDDSSVADPALAFPDAPGYLVFNFGRTEEVAPVKYLGRLSDTELLLDASFTFPNDVLSGVTITLLSGRSPFIPARNALTGSFYLTGSAAGRVAAQASLNDATAAGLDIDVEVVYPGDRGLGGEGFPSKGADKLSDKVQVWGGDDLDAEIAAAEEA